MKREGTILKQVIGLIVSIVVMSMSGGFWLLHARQEIERMAQDSRSIEKEIVKEERRVRYLETKIAEIHQPEYLQRQNLLLGLNLRPPTSDQIIYLSRRSDKTYIATNGSPEESVKKRDPFRHSFDLAVMEPVRSVD